MIEICIIGSGNVARAFAERLSATGRAKLAGIASRNPDRGREIAARAGCAWSWPQVPKADLYIAAVKDDSIEQVCRRTDFPSGAVVAHTSGCTPMEAIGRTHAGVIYPLQSFAADAPVDWANTPLFTEWSTPEARRTVQTVAELMSDNVRPLDSQRRASLHLAGVFANNFPNLMHAICQRILEDANLDFGTVVPMIMRSAEKLSAGYMPADIQSGPAVRGDMLTQRRHLDILHRRYPQYERLYETLSSMIWETLRRT